MAFAAASLAVAVALPGCGHSQNKASTSTMLEKSQATYVQQDDGIVVSLSASPVKRVRLQVIAEDIVRVTATPQTTFNNLPDYLMVTAEPMGVPFDVTESADVITLKTLALSAKVSKTTGLVSFFNAQGERILSEATRGSFGKVIDEPGQPDSDSYSVTQKFVSDKNESFYGLGQQQNGEVNYKGMDVEMTTYNMEITIPYLVSSKNYGILWNNAAVSRFGDPRPAAPLADAFEMIDTQGKAGGLTVNYYDGDQLLLSRQEADTNYQFYGQGTEREFPLPPEAQDAKNLRITLEGSLKAKASGEHTLKMYSSGYAKLYLDGALKLDRWRMNWNPWYHNVSFALKAGETKKIAVDWQPGGGFLRLLQNAPQSPTDEQLMALSSDTAKAIDYYVVLGDNKDDLVSGYRTLTGKAVLLPKWAYGFWQSRERYKTQDEIIENLKEYRERKIPIDNIVLDWSYWPADAWGSHDFDSEFFPDPKGLVDAVHDLNAQIMISVWPKFYPTTEHYKELNAKGYMFNKNIEQKNLDWIGEGYLNTFYDAFAPEARDIFWRQLHEKINVLGFDAWWLDAVEPDIHSNLSFTHRKDLMTPNHLGTGAEYFNAYALPHAESVYQGDREADPDQRVFILTRSGFGGIQRTASAVWSGDIVSRWSNLKEQIAAGIGIGISGMPNWTFDIGGFTPEDRYRHGDKKEVGPVGDMDPKQVDEWQELNTRWYQFGAFAPLYRAHGQNPYREIFNIADEGTPTYESLVWYTELRYRLMPYIYTEAGDMYHKDDTLMRGLVMDFADDPKVADIADQYMFGPALLVNPVSEFKARSRELYLPAGSDWFDLYSGKRFSGGKTLHADAPYSRIPVFVKSGSIVPTGVALQHVYDKPNAPITLNVFVGEDGSYELYEDDGKTYNYEHGEWSRIPFTYNHKKGTLTIGDRQGAYKGMPAVRTFHVRWIAKEGDNPTDFSAKPDATVTYTGKALTVKM